MTLQVFSEVDLNDDADYYGGYKAPWIISWDPIVRGLSDREGRMQHLAFGMKTSDAGAMYFRTLLGNRATKYLTNQPGIVRIIDDEDRRQKLSPTIVANGFVSDYSPLPNLQFQTTFADWLQRRFTQNKLGLQAWQPLILQADFPTCDPSLFKQGAPIIYGSLGTSGMAGVVGVTVTQGAQPGSALTGLSVTPTAGGFSNAGVTVWYMVTQVIGGAEVPLIGPVPGTTDQTNRSMTVTWSGATGPVRLYRGVQEAMLQYDVAFLTAGTNSFVDQWCDEDDHSLDSTGAILNSNPWILGLRMNCVYYVFAKLADGTYSQPGDAAILYTPIAAQPGDNPVRRSLVSWTAYSGAVGYTVVRHRSWYSNWDPQNDRQWDFGPGVTSFEDDIIDTTPVTIPGLSSTAPQLIGAVQVVPVGRTRSTAIIPSYILSATKQPLNVLLVARHAVHRLGRIDIATDTTNTGSAIQPGAQVFAKVPNGAFGHSWWAPFHVGWVGSNYIDINGRRYTLIFTTVDPLPSSICVDVDGIEDVGDSTGNLITSGPQQFKHFCDNWMSYDLATAATIWHTTSQTFPQLPSVFEVDNASFDAADLVLQGRVAGGYVGAGVIGYQGELVGAEDAISRFAVSYDLDVGFNSLGQLIVSAEPINPDPNALLVDDVMDIIDGSFSVTDRVTTDFFNDIAYVHTQDLTGRVTSGWISTASNDLDIDDPVSVAGYGQIIQSAVFNFYFLRNTSAAMSNTLTDVKVRKLNRYTNPWREVTFSVPLIGTLLDIGQQIRVTAIDGVGATGFVGEYLRVIQHSLDLNKLLVTLTCYDLLGSFGTQLGAALANVIIPYELGGSRSRGSVPAASTWVDVEEFNDIVVDGSNSLQKFIVVQRRTDDAGTSVNTRLVDRDNSDAVIWTGTAATSTSWAFDTRTLITLNASATHRYVLQVWRNNAIAAVYAKGRIEEVVTS